MKWWWMISLLFCTVSTAQAAPILADISSHSIEIHSGFTGTQLLLFGARNESGDIVVLIRGPHSDMVVRKKERSMGIWLNRSEVRFDDMPRFYSIASSRPLDKVRQYKLFDPLDIYANIPTSEENKPFGDAMQQILTQQGLYHVAEGDVEFMGEALFKARFDFPDNMPRGDYVAEAYLFDDGQLIAMRSIPIEVFKTGFDALMYDTSENNSFIYGLLAVLLAISVGWVTSWLFRRL